MLNEWLVIRPLIGLTAGMTSSFLPQLAFTHSLVYSFHVNSVHTLSRALPCVRAHKSVTLLPSFVFPYHWSQTHAQKVRKCFYSFVWFIHVNFHIFRHWHWKHKWIITFTAWWQIALCSYVCVLYMYSFRSMAMLSVWDEFDTYSWGNVDQTFSAEETDISSQL